MRLDDKLNLNVRRTRHGMRRKRWDTLDDAANSFNMTT
jgi:hypothetical protein